MDDRGKFDEAITHYRKALKLNPDYVDALNNLGAALAGHGRLDEAIDCFRQSLHINPNHAITHFNLGVTLARHGDRSEALDEYRAALQLAAAQNDRGLAEAIQARIMGLTGGR